MNARNIVTKATDQDAATAKLIFGGERFVSLPKVASIIEQHFDELGHGSVRVAEASLTSLNVFADNLRLTLDICFENHETLLHMTVQHETCGQKGLIALAEAVYPVTEKLPVAFVVWAGTDLRIPRDAFVNGLVAQFGGASEASPDTQADAPESMLIAQQDQAQPANEIRIVPRRVAAKAGTSTSRREKSAATLPADVIVKASQSKACAPVPYSFEAASEWQDAHVQAYEFHLRGEILTALSAAQDDENADGSVTPLPIEARLSTWAVSLSVATVSLQVAAPVMIYNIARGEDLRVASLAMGLAGLFLALDSSGAMASVTGL